MLITKVIINILLFLIYFIGFGLIFLLALLFKRKLLFPKSKGKSTYWELATGYDSDLEDSFFQS